jgi:response regulator RpfG family c-di-GMP phosphodiesterase
MQKEGTLMKETVLVLDDDEQIRDNLEHHLSKSGYRILTASTIAEAKKWILSEAIDYSIVDLQIDYESEYGGINAVNYVKRKYPKSKTIIISANPLDKNAKKLLDFKVDGYIYKIGIVNYITAVKNKLTEFKNQAEKKKCFVIMPFSKTESCDEKEWTEIFNRLIRPAVEKSGNYTCKRSEALIGNIIEKIFKDLNGADLVIADLTDRNPNVFYELGVRQSICDATILIAQKKKDIPFDLQNQAWVTYNWKTDEDKKKFRVRIKEIISTLENDPAIGASPIKGYLSVYRKSKTISSKENI